MKLLVKTTGPFQLQCHDSAKLIRATGCTVVDKTTFVEHRTALAQLVVVAQLGDKATDDEWLEYARECGADETLAVESFKSEFPLDEKYTLPNDAVEAAVVKEQRAAKAKKV